MTDILSYLKEHKIIAILRGVEGAKLVDTAKALYNGGIRCVEVTFDQKGGAGKTSEAIATLSDVFSEKLVIGAGTVMTLKQLDLAFQAGAQYIISPDTNPEIIEKTKDLGLISMPGAFTPTEIAFAHACGADVVKLFPAGVLGVEYVKAIKAPLNHITLAAVGGISLENIDGFAKAGIEMFGLGSNIAKADLIKQNKFEEITQLCEKYVHKLGK